MNDQSDLTEEQKARIVEMLKRIRSGLKRSSENPFEEPSHIFKPEAFNAEQQ